VVTRIGEHDLERAGLGLPMTSYAAIIWSIPNRRVMIGVGSRW